MTLPNKVAQFNADSNTVNAWLNGPASGAGSTLTTAGGTLRTPAKLIADKDADINAAANGVLVQTVTASVVATTAQATATAQAVVSTTGSVIASNAKTAAEAARDAANAVGKVFTSTALGLAGTTSGQSFSVLSADLLDLIVYTNASGVATELLRYYTKAYTDTSYDASYTLLSGYLWGVVDSNNRIAIFINAAGGVEIPAVGVVADHILSLESNVEGTYSDASGYSWAVADKNGKVAMGLDLAGDLTIPNTAKLDTSFGPASGYLWGVADAAGKIAIGVNNAGNLVAGGIELGNPDGLFTSSDYLKPSTNIVCWGDSLTHGNTSGVTVPYPTALQSLLPSRTVTNNGTSGQTSVQIACKSGARATLISVASNTIPASGAVNVAFNSGSLTSNSNLGTLSYLGALFGIPGTLAVPYSGTATFTRTVAGAVTQIPNKCPFLPTRSGFDFQTVVIWSGYNNKSDAATVLADVARMVADLKPVQKRFVILTVINARYEIAGSTEYNQVITINDALLAAYPENIIDIRKILINAGTDPTDLANDVYPAALTSDGLHLNDAGYQLVANTVYSSITSKGW